MFMRNVSFKSLNLHFLFNIKLQTVYINCLCVFFVSKLIVIVVDFLSHFILYLCTVIEIHVIGFFY